MLNRRYPGAAIFLLSLLSAQSHGQSAALPPAIVGAWLLESIVDTLEDGLRSNWMGPHPTEAAELRDVVKGYYAYFGRYEVSPTSDAITHFVETSLRPNEVGVVYKRAIRIEGDQLFISLRAEVDGVSRQRVLTWRRAAADRGR